MMTDSKISCSLGWPGRCGLGVPFAVMAREKLPQASYWEFSSPMPVRICGWVRMTWNASMNASWHTFQLQRITLATCAWM